MKTNFLKFLSVALVLGTCALLQSCNCDDVKNPEINWAKQPANPVLTGVVSCINGPIKDATITVNLGEAGLRDVTTDENGTYTLSDLKAGKFPATCEVRTGGKYTTPSTEVDLAEDKVTVWNVFLSEKNEESFEVTGEDQVFSIELPYIAPEEESEAESQMAHYYVGAGAIESGDHIILTSAYDYRRPHAHLTAPAKVNDRSMTAGVPDGYKATEDFVVVEVTSHSLKGATTTAKPVTVRVEDMAAPVLVLHNGKPVEFTDYVDERGQRHTEFQTTELGLTEFFFEIYVGDRKTHLEPIEFTPNEFSGRLEKIEAEYQYTAGSKIYFTHTFLDHYVAIIEGARDTKKVDAVLHLIKEVPAGEKLLIYGNQQVAEYTYLCGVGKVRVTHYGSVLITYKDRMHTGGSSN